MIVVNVIGVVILLVANLFKRKKRKPATVGNQQDIQNDTIEKEDIEVKLKQIDLPSRSLNVEYLNQNSTLSGYKPVPADGEYALSAKNIYTFTVVQRYVSEYGLKP